MLQLPGNSDAEHGWSLVIFRVTTHSVGFFTGFVTGFCYRSCVSPAMLRCLPMETRPLLSFPVYHVGHCYVLVENPYV